MRIANHKILASLLVLFTIHSFAQQGPGGVSVETAIFNSGSCRPDTNSTCGMWLDASTLTAYADGDNVLIWPDVSLSYDCDDATVPSGELSPFFRNDPAYTINGLPTISFEDNRFYILESSDDLNTDEVTYDKNVFMAFRASEDINTKQVMYEEGGGKRGFNIIIQDGSLIIGAYDKQLDGDSSGTVTPAWGYSYISQVIQPNTTYILTATFHASSAGSIGNNSNNYLKGWLNGISFGGPGQLAGGFTGNGYDGSAVMGTLYKHPDACGLGAVNHASVNRDGVVPDDSGSLAFRGKLAEVCYYKDILSETQRIIIENYLAAKYIATLTTQDYYDHEFTFGKDLIGIGHGANQPSHNLSRGRNPFVISAPTFSSVDNFNRYFLTGHNGLNNTWTNAGTPGNSANIERLQRVWRVDRTNFIHPIQLTLDEDKLPIPPTGFTVANSRLVLLVDETSANIPDFTLASTVVKEISKISSAPYDYQITYNIPNGAFYTFAWLKPEVNFDEFQSIAIEGNSPAYTTKNIGISLNYEPVNNGDMVDDKFFVDYNLLAGSATLGPGLNMPNTDDFYYDNNAGGITSGQAEIAEGTRTSYIPIRIINDAIGEDPSTEDFSINISGTTSLGNSPSLIIGENDSLPYTIYDDDPDPKISFSSFNTTISVNESAGTLWVYVVRNGTGPNLVTCKVRVLSAGTTARGTASGLNPQDYDSTFTSQVISFPLGPPVLDSIAIPIIDDLIDEATESIKLQLYDFTGFAGTNDVFEIEQSIVIVDNDIPIATFAAEGQSGFESIGSPSLLVTLDPISAREVVVDFTMTGGTATLSNDFSGDPDGIVVFPPFIDQAFLGPFFVYPDDSTEVAETVFFDLTGTTPNGDPTLAQPDQLTYTILDYQPFEWKGAGGVGKSIDNVIWVDASQESLGDLDLIINRSPYGLDILKKDQPAENILNGINGQNALEFNGHSAPNSADAYQVESSDKINLAGSVDKLSYYFVIQPTDIPNSNATPDNPNSNHARVIYEQGGGTRGTSIYLYNDSLYFHAWNNTNDDGDDDTETVTIEGNQAPWGNNDDRTNSLFAKSAQKIFANTNYIISCHYDNANLTDPLRIYVNGVKGTMSNLSAGDNEFGVGRLWGHSTAIGLGGSIGKTRTHFSSGKIGQRKCPFQGLLGEFISFHEPEMSETRRVIVANYLSGKYDIALDNSDTPQIWDLSDPLEATFSHDIAGLGQEEGAVSSHTDSKGPTSILRVKTAIFNGTSEAYLMWGHNNEALTNTWPYSNPTTSLPPGINERSGQVWKFFESGDVSTVTISVDFSASDNASALSANDNLLKLLVHSDNDPQDFSNATVYSLAQTPTGGTGIFENIVVTDNMYVTLGNTGSYFNTPLPIELLSFGAKLKQGQVDLNWITSTEINNDYFVVERADSDFKWEVLMQVNGAGNSNTILYYNEKDREPLTGISYYRLRQVDFDGTSTYSEIVSINNNVLDKNEFYLYPNPNNSGTVFLSIPESSGTLAKISMFDISGKLLFQQISNPNVEINELHYGKLNPGIYLISVNSELLYVTKKLVVE